MPVLIGEVQDTDCEALVFFVKDFFYFEDCLLIEAAAGEDEYTAPGDSGSIIFSQTPLHSSPLIHPAVGLHFSGPNEDNSIGVACKIRNVFAQLDLEPVCNGLFASFMEAMFEIDSLGAVSTGTEQRMRGVSALAARARTRSAPPPFVPRERRWQRARTLHRGITRDIQERLMATKRGRIITGFVDRYRAELASMLVSDGDVRRSTVAAFQPLVAGATTTTDVLERTLTSDDLARLDKLAREVARKSGTELKAALKAIMALRRRAEGKSLGEILGIKTEYS